MASSKQSVCNEDFKMMEDEGADTEEDTTHNASVGINGCVRGTKKIKG